MSFTFKDLTLLQAEEALVAGALDHEHMMIEALRLPWRFFRSESGADLERIFYILAAWYRLGTYDGMTNRDRLGKMLCARSEVDIAYWVEETLFDGATAVKAYCVALVDALLATYEVQDAEVAATRARLDAPIGDVGRWSPPKPTTLTRFTR